jgi:hypothetical protein
VYVHACAYVILSLILKRDVKFSINHVNSESSYILINDAYVGAIMKFICELHRTI